MEDNRVLRNALFRATEEQRPVTQVTATPLVGADPILVYVVPDDASIEVKKGFLLLLQVCGTSSSTKRNEWRNYVATLASTCFLELRRAIVANPEHQEVILTEEFCGELRRWYENCIIGSDDQDGDAELRAASMADAQAWMPGLDLPAAMFPEKVNVEETLRIEAYQGHFSLVLFLAGKTINANNRSSITQKRPSAIQRKYFSGKQVACLSGPLSLSVVAHGEIHGAFVAMSHVRRVIFELVANFNTLGGNTATDVVATTTRLMRFAGMQQAIIIDKFLSSHEEAYSVPMLAPAIASYASSLQTLARVPEAYRPYYKIIHGDTSRVFHRNDVEHLLIVAIKDASATNPTLLQYALPDNSEIVMDHYRSALAVLAKEEAE